jgi:xanthine phosphoribosyltransferase
VNQSSQSLPVTWDQFHRDSRALAWRPGAGPFDAVVASPAASWCRARSWRAGSASRWSRRRGQGYDHQNQGEIKVLKAVAPEISPSARRAARS